MSTTSNCHAGKRRTGGSLTRERFLLPEIRVVARLRLEGVPDEQIVEAAVADNIFQFPTIKEARSVARACLARLDALDSQRLVELAAAGAPEQQAQVNVYAIMQLYDLMHAFMIDEIGSRYSMLDYTFTQMDMNAFMTHYTAENSVASRWTDATVKRLKAMLYECLDKGGFLAKGSDALVPILIDAELECAIRAKGDLASLPAFNCLEV